MWRRLFPLQCPSCNRRGAGRCEVCWSTFPVAVPAPPPSGVHALACPFAYDGRVRNLVLAAKATAAHGWLNVMADALPVLEKAPPKLLVTWPTGSARHRRQRGFDPAERIARRYAKGHGFVAAEVLIRDGEAQEGRSAAERADLRFVARGPLNGVSVLVIDDVVTTGSSLRAAAAALRAAGAVDVWAVAFARRR